MRAALIVVDVQNDFCPGGALAVKDGDEIIPKLNKVILAFEHAGLPIFFTRDWHPPNHISFKEQGGPWPPHCVQGTPGAEFHLALRTPSKAIVVSKGDNPKVEAYSGFQGTGLDTRLKLMGVNQVFIGGLATDYCVKESTLDARRAGFEARVIEDCIRAVNVKPGDGKSAISQMRKAGAKMTTSNAVIYRLTST